MPIAMDNSPAKNPPGGLTPRPGRPLPRWMIVVLAIALAVFTARGIWRGISNSIDVKMIYAASLSWAEGGQAYSSSHILERFRQRGGDSQHRLVAERFYSLYPPSTYLLISPLTILDWPAAKWAWLGVNCAAMGVVILLGARLARLASKTEIAWWTIAALMFAPTHITLSQGQLSLVCLALMLGGVALLQDRRDISAGILLALAAVLKPQVGGVLVLALPIARRWRSLGTCAVTGLLVMSAAAARLQLADPGWLGSMFQNISELSALGSGALLESSGWHILIGLESIVSRFTHHLWLISATSYGICALLAALIAWEFWRADNRDARAAFILLCAALSALTLLPGYHRPYDGVVLLPACAVMVRRLVSQRRGGLANVLTLAGLSVFFLPNSAVLGRVLADRLGLGGSVAFQATVMSNQAWGALGVVAGMTLAIRSLARGPTETIDRDVSDSTPISGPRRG